MRWLRHRTCCQRDQAVSDQSSWWRKPRKIRVVVDNPSWILPYAETLAERLIEGGDDAILCRHHDEIELGDVAFYLGCVRVTPSTVLERNRKNLVVHASDLPKGRGFSPLTWQTLEGENTIPVCLFEACEELDAGSIIFRVDMHFEGHELLGEMRKALGDMHIELCTRFLAQHIPPLGTSQTGEPTYYARRTPDDSEIDPGRSLADQFDLLRVVDNEKYPAFFHYRGRQYRLTIEKMEEGRKQ